MGYYTNYALSWDPPENAIIPNLSKKIAKYIDSVVGCEDANEYDIYIGEAKWYNHMDDMYTLSKEFPTVLFHLWGDGDESDDLWEDHWQNGMVHHCCAEIPPFDRKKMILYSKGEQAG